MIETSLYGSFGDARGHGLRRKRATLANSIAIYYQNQSDGSWLSVDQQNNLETVDFGNGTYGISFSAYTPGSVNVSAQVNDLRDIFAMANATCVQA